MMNTFTGRLYCTHVIRSCMVIWKLPSPSMSITSVSGNAAWAPMAAGIPNPMVPSPPEVIQRRGPRPR
jgi:hypothetical protein